jgi:hypothetical protein
MARTIPALLTLALLFTGKASAKEPLSTQQFTTNLDLYKTPVSAPSSRLQDALYDYEVWSAPDTSGQTEFVILGLFPETGAWDLVHRFDWQGTPDHGMYLADKGVWTFSSSWSALQAAENLMDDGEITGYEIVEQPVEPQWSYEATFGTRAQAEEFASLFEEIAADVGAPHITRIVPVNTLQFSYYR